MSRDIIHNNIECYECNKHLSEEDCINYEDYPYNYLKYSDEVYLFCNDCYKEKINKE